MSATSAAKTNAILMRVRSFVISGFMLIALEKGGTMCGHVLNTVFINNLSHDVFGLHEGGGCVTSSQHSNPQDAA